MSFKVGDEVVCINDTNQTPYFPLVKVGKKYTIEQSNDTIARVPAVQILEVGFQFKTDIPRIWGYKSSRFRLIDEQSNFKSSKASRKLANDAMKEVKEYIPQKVEAPIEVPIEQN